MRTSSKWVAAMATSLTMLSAAAIAGAPPVAIGSHGGSEPSSAAATKRIQMDGNFSYSLVDGVATVRLDNIVNLATVDMSGVMRLELWATPVIPNSGTRITGVRLATFPVITSLQSNDAFTAIEQTAPFQAPPDGTYTIVLALLQAGMAGCDSTDGFCVVDSFVARAPESFGSEPTNYSDLWYNPDDTGWGLSLVQRGTTAFGVIYVYDESGNPKWYAAPNLQQSGNTFSGPLYETRSAAEAARAAKSAVEVNEVGTLTLTFGGSGSGTVAYTVRGTTSTRPIVRQIF